MTFSQNERAQLLEIARGAIRDHVRGQLPPPARGDGAMSAPAGCFVSLHLGEDLRGCIGTFRTDRPLCEAVRDMAVAAASEDPRFPPVCEEEVSGLSIEISVLGPRRAIDGPAEIEVGRHGLWIQRGVLRGVLLPQVATEYRWDAETFLRHTCEKAGLPPDAWSDPSTAIEVFEAEVFGEHPRLH